jgi:hypothetical protein
MRKIDSDLLIKSLNSDIKNISKFSVPFGIIGFVGCLLLAITGGKGSIPLSIVIFSFFMVLGYRFDAIELRLDYFETRYLKGLSKEVDKKDDELKPSEPLTSFLYEGEADDE